MMKRLNLILLVLLIILLVVIIYFLKYSPGLVVFGGSKTPCIDNDGGLNYYKYGVVYYRNITLKDKCLDNNTLQESYCVYTKATPSGQGDYANYKCPNGCKNSVCIKISK